MSTQELSTQEFAETSVPPAVWAWSRLMRAHSTTTRALSVSLQAEHGLSLNDYEALYVLALAEGRRLKRVELSRKLLLTPSGVTRLLEGLERSGLVARVTCPTDLRVAYAELTDAGAEKLRAARCGHVRAIQTLFEDHLDAGEIDELADILGRLPGVSDEGDACPAASR